MSVFIRAVACMAAVASFRARVDVHSELGLARADAEGKGHEQHSGDSESTPKATPPKATNPVLAAANQSTNLAWTAFIPGNAAGWSGDKIPGVGRCIAAMIRLSDQVLNDPSQEFQQALAADPSKADRSKALSQQVALRIDKEMYRDLYRKRMTLWKLVEEKHLAKGIVLAYNSALFPEMSLEEALQGQNKSVWNTKSGTQLCPDYSGVHENILAVDKVMLKSLVQIGSERLDIKGLLKAEINVKKLNNAEFVKFKESLVQSSIGRAVHAGEAMRKEEAANHKYDAMLGDRGLAIKNWLSGDTGKLALATAFLAKGIVQSIFQGASTGVYAACDLLHRISDFSSAIQSSSVFGDTYLTSGPCTLAKNALDEQAATPLPEENA